MEIKKPRDEWTKVGDDEVAIPVIRGKRKFVVLWNASIANTNKEERLSKLDLSEIEIIESYRVRDQIEKLSGNEEFYEVD
jgi:hypothetical protein